MTSPRAAGRRAAVLSAALVAAVPLGLAGAGGAAAGTGAATLTAVVSLAGATPVSAPGVEVVAALPAVHSEVVRGTAAAVDGLRGRAGVLGIAPNRAVHLASRQYGHAKAEENRGHEVAGPAGAGVTVAVIDTGVSDTAVLSRRSGRLVDAVDTSGLVGDAPRPVREHGRFTDGYGHGTYVASLVAGGALDGRAIGSAPAATVDVVKVARDDGTTSLAAVVAGLNWVATHADSVQVANLSLSVSPAADTYGLDPLNLAVELTVAQGVTVVAAAGNQAGTVSDPGFDPLALTAGAADLSGAQPTVDPDSGSGDVLGITKPDVVAAGDHILGVVPTRSVVGSDDDNHAQAIGDGTSTIVGSGTSGAAAVLSGYVADFLAEHHGAAPADVAASFRAAASPLDATNAGAGLVTGAPDDLVPADGAAARVVQSPEWKATADLWPADFWNDDLWSIRSWSIRSWSVRSWSIRSWSVRSWSIRSWSVRSWSIRSWSVRSWSMASWGR